MNASTPRLIFAALCAIGFIVIAAGAWWEVARHRRGAALGEGAPRQLKMRLFSAVLWMAIFAINGYAILALVPTATPKTPEYRAEARQFLNAFAIAFSLLIPALVLLVIDLLQTARERRQQTLQLHQNMADMLREQSATLKRINSEPAGAPQPPTESEKSP